MGRFTNINVSTETLSMDNDAQIKEEVEVIDAKTGKNQWGELSSLHKGKETLDLIELQKEYCDKNKAPMFAPSNGKCWYCGEICVTERWAIEHITGCSKCHHTFCD